MSTESEDTAIKAREAVDRLVQPDGPDRADATPIVALAECYDSWSSGAWDDRNAQYNLEETMLYIERLLALEGDNERT